MVPAGNRAEDRKSRKPFEISPRHHPPRINKCPLSLPRVRACLACAVVIILMSSRESPGAQARIHPPSVPRIGPHDGRGSHGMVDILAMAGGGGVARMGV